jgi:hypothetical protein
LAACLFIAIGENTMRVIAKFSAAAAVIAGTLAAGAAVAGPYDGDPGYNAIQRQRTREYCYNHPYSDRCESYRYYMHRGRRHDYDSGRCVGSMVHSVGRAWIPYGIARNSAIKAWEKETRVDYGSQYADWGRAESKSITCGPSGTGFGQICEAKGRPCQ